MRGNHSNNRAFVRHAGNLAPFVLTCEHAHGRLPPGVSTTARDRAALRAHWGWDIGAWALTRAIAAELRTGATGGRWSRLWIDLNRPAGDPMLVRKTIEGHPLSWNAGVDEREIERRYAAIHVPYHREVDRQIARRLERGVRPVLLAVHTYTPRLNGRLRTFDAGVLYDENRGEAMRLAAALRGAGLEVRYNQPYSGRRGLMYSIDRHGRHYRLPCLELEINQALFSRPGKPTRLARAVAHGLRDIEARTRGRR
ncbi:MAG: N-formylglutamate amidohydrolase [Acidobacteria bacterium]|nr:N-formylglutamate amidohydrolase [Acidobacteriota bacterium]NIM60735.1 N-formylglutamate amidohydrolase [Acidobacteriota bacterium]NIO57948.1 N-formylglutamate amidohydrolase [Acidobacteriota bacterium]NIQ28953.1 N-formylglutamate amidohydrolase [Acidobacteriota bacterium]NIQ83425.1 N-formylglutamate amidohydrolase [Acidobacteriota bacterium]